ISRCLIGSLGVRRSMNTLGRISSLSLAISGRLMECSPALLKSRLHVTARPSRVLYPPRSLKFGTDSKSMCLGYTVGSPVPPALGGEGGRWGPVTGGGGPAGPGAPREERTERSAMLLEAPARRAEGEGLAVLAVAAEVDVAGGDDPLGPLVLLGGVGVEAVVRSRDQEASGLLLALHGVALEEAVVAADVEADAVVRLGLVGVVGAAVAGQHEGVGLALLGVVAAQL